MAEKKFYIGDRVRLESPFGSDDPNEDVEGIVVEYCTSRDNTPGLVVKICDGYTWSDPKTREVNWLGCEWWKLVEQSGECFCESLL